MSASSDPSGMISAPDSNTPARSRTERSGRSQSSVIVWWSKNMWVPGVNRGADSARLGAVYMPVDPRPGAMMRMRYRPAPSSFSPGFLASSRALPWLRRK